MKTFKNNLLFVAMGALLFFAPMAACFVPMDTTVAVHSGVRPSWAPEYNGDYRYYYMPDIEVYYDVWNQEYVYLENGMWMFSPTLPAMYAGYDLYNGHVVVLYEHVYEPWRHHNLYMEHYPRYYYHSVYRPSDEHPNHPRGFNENVGRPIYAPRNVIPSNTIQQPRNNGSTPQRTQPVEYQGHGVGQPVRIDRHVTAPRGR